MCSSLPARDPQRSRLHLAREIVHDAKSHDTNKRYLTASPTARPCETVWMPNGDRASRRIGGAVEEQGEERGRIPRLRIETWGTAVGGRLQRARLLSARVGCDGKCQFCLTAKAWGPAQPHGRRDRPGRSPLLNGSASTLGRREGHRHAGRASTCLHGHGRALPETTIAFIASVPPAAARWVSRVAHDRLDHRHPQPAMERFAPSRSVQGLALSPERLERPGRSATCRSRAV